MAMGCPYGTHRVVEPAGVLPQAAWRLDPSRAIADNEIRVTVETLNIDSASFLQLKQEAGSDTAAIARRVQHIVAERGKIHNPVTGSGGVLVGRVDAIGPALADRDLRVGDEIVTLVSLSLTPLHLDAVVAVRPAEDQVDVRGHAVLFESGLYARIPSDLPRPVVLAALDVCGAPAGAARLTRPGMTVLVLGAGGKSGLLTQAAIRKVLGPAGRLVALDRDAVALDRARELGAADVYVQADATRPLAVLQAVADALGGPGRTARGDTGADPSGGPGGAARSDTRTARGDTGADARADLTLVCVNVPGAEMGAILATRPTGTVYFFSMATSFTAATLGAEGAGSPVTLLMGNGYVPGHAAFTLDLLRENPTLLALMGKLSGAGS